MVEMSWSNEQDFEQDLAEYGAQGLGELLDSILAQVTPAEDLTQEEEIDDAVLNAFERFRDLHD